MELKVQDRLILFNMLPGEGDFKTLKTIRKLREALSFTEEENNVFQFKSQGDKYIDADGNESEVLAGQIYWNGKEDVPKEIEITELGKSIIAEKFKELDQQKKLTDFHFDLYSKFIPDEEEK